MVTLKEMWELGQFFMLVIPSVLVVVGMGLVGARKREGWERRRLLFLLASTAISIGLLDLLILTNPYGREISSSLTAIGMLPVTVALLATLFNQPEELRALWRTDKPLLVSMAVAILALLGVLWWLEALTLYVVVLPTAVMALALLLTRRAGLLWLTVLTLLIASGMLWVGGGSFSIPDMDMPSWQGTLRAILSGAVILLTILLPAAMLYASLRGEEGLDRRKLGWSLVLAAVLVGCALYQVYWEGIWSAAHARAFEDHLPFAQLLLSLMAGVLLALSLRGRRRWVGAAYALSVTVLSVAALSAGWRVSAFALTAQRAARVERAIQAYQQARGSYPEDLGELTPRYLLFLPPPVVVRQGSWCYQGGDHAYRLGYVSGDFTYFEAKFREEVSSQAGAFADNGAWRCGEMVQLLEQGKANY
jgi:hypothetical protein